MNSSRVCKRGIGLAALMVILSGASITQADVLWLAGEDQPIYGVVESSNDQQVMFRQTTDGQSFDLRAIKRSDIRTMVVNHDARVLASLSPGDWEPWLRLVETLHSQQQDPVARDLAMRLLVIVIANTEADSERASAIETLLSLARSDAERQQLERLRYLETGAGKVADEDPAEEIGAADRVAVADMVRGVRLQQITHDELSANTSAEKVVASLGAICSWQELLVWSRSNRIDDRARRRLVELELSLRDPSRQVSRRGWHQSAQQIGGAELTLPTIETVTEFDPAATKFEDGAWVEP